MIANIILLTVYLQMFHWNEMLTWWLPGCKVHLSFRSLFCLFLSGRFTVIIVSLDLFSVYLKTVEHLNFKLLN